MELFKKKSYIGIYSLYDPAVKDKACKFSPPFFSPADDLACSALCETVRRHFTSFEAFMSSEFLRMELWRLGSCDLSEGSLVTKRTHKYCVCELSEYFKRDYVKNYMQSIPYPTVQEISKNEKDV